MTTLAHRGSTQRHTHLRAYLAATGSSGALIAGAIIVFLSLAAYVAFKGLPLGKSSGELATSLVGASSGGPPEEAAAGLAAAPGAVAATPVPGAPVGFAAGPGGARPPHGGSAGGPNGATAAAEASGSETVAASSGSDRIITGAVGSVDETAQGLGVDTNLSGATGSVTRPLDNTVNEALNGGGAAAGHPDLGNRAGRLSSRLGGLLGGGR